MTGAQSEIPAGERFCPRCGHEMDVRKVRPGRVRGRPSRHALQWDLVCPGCGLETGFGVAPLVRYGRHRNPLARLYDRLGDLTGLWSSTPTATFGDTSPVNPFLWPVHIVTGLWQARAQRRSSRSRKYLRPDGMLDLTLLLADLPFPVYGLRGHPLGLQLRSPGWGAENDVLTEVRLGYVTGNPLRPEKALQLAQGGPAYVEHPSREMRGTDVVHDLIANYAPSEGKEPFDRMEEVNRDWNWNRLREAERRPVTLTIAGTVVEAEIASWKEPRLVNLASITMRDGSLVAASLAISEAEFLHVLESLVRLQGAPDLVDEHQRDAEAGRAELRKEHEERHS